MTMALPARTPPARSITFPQLPPLRRRRQWLSPFSHKAVNGVNASDLLIDGAGATSVSSNNANYYTFFFPQPPTGTVFIAWAANHGITDAAALANPFGGGNFIYTLDTNLANNGMPIIS